MQDALTGYVHEAPEFGYAEAPEAYGQVAYDGLGNPVGWLPWAQITPPPRILWSPSLRRFVRWVFSPTQNRWVQTPVPPGATPYRTGLPYSPGRPWPLGWIRPSLPYTGLGPNRLYMRCAVWPGPKGLVPALAAQMPAAGPVGPGGPGGPGGRRRRFRRRR
jgi:hypothetical protein